MFFVASKIFWMFASPIDLLLFAGLAGALLCRGRFARPAQAVATAAILLLIAAATPPLGLLLIAPLEDRFPQPPADAAPPDGIIVLGGAINGPISQARGQTAFDQGERITEAVLLAKRFPKARVIFTGGTGSLVSQDSTEAPQARKLMTELGIDPARITLEERSRNTEENAKFTAQLIHPEPSQRFIVVTSAYHMPRSMGLFEKAGFTAIPYPVAYRTPGIGGGQPWDFDPPATCALSNSPCASGSALQPIGRQGGSIVLFPGPKTGSPSPHSDITRGRDS